MKKKKIIGIVFTVAIILSVGVAAYAATGGFTMTYLPGTSDTVTNMPAADSGVGGQPYTVSAIIPRRDGYEFLNWTLDYGLAQTYTLNYQVTGDPIYGIPGDTTTPDPVTGILEGGSVTLASALTTAWETENGDPAPTEETCYVNYLEIGTDRVLAEQRSISNQKVGSLVTEQADYIDGYKYIGSYPGDTITIQPSRIGKWTFTGWCSDEACTNPITEAKNISADTTVYGKWTFEWVEVADNTITFYYKAQPLQ